MSTVVQIAHFVAQQNQENFMITVSYRDYVDDKISAHNKNTLSR